MTYNWHWHCIVTKQIGDSRREAMTLKIQRSIKRDNAIFNLCGQIDAKELPELRRLLAAEEQKYLVLDLKEVRLVDREALRFLIRCQESGIKVKNCPAYIREWLAREATQS
jgi:ABC-type transporter Mla MlaB component